jgi:hypothetical protein
MTALPVTEVVREGRHAVALRDGDRLRRVLRGHDGAITGVERPSRTLTEIRARLLELRAQTRPEDGWIGPVDGGTKWVRRRGMGEAISRLGLTWTDFDICWMTPHEEVRFDERNGGLTNGYYSCENGRHRIHLRSGRSGIDTSCTFCHEMGHALAVEILGADFDRIYEADGGTELERLATETANALADIEIFREV